MKQKECWVFAYGSLMWRPGFEFFGYVPNYKRRFWQGSTDHRGTFENPGRVVSLVKHDCPDAYQTHPDIGYTWGICYEIPSSKVSETISYLDNREGQSYEKIYIDVYKSPYDKEAILYDVLLYVATEKNMLYMGPAPSEQIACQIQQCQGKSGKNVDYLLELSNILRKNQIYEPHIESIRKLINIPISGKTE